VVRGKDWGIIFKKRLARGKHQELIMLTGSIPKLLQEAHAVKQALEQIGEGLPAGISASELSESERKKPKRKASGTV